MLGCKTRGYSFTRALLGLCADEVHLCGDAAVVPLIQEILKVTGDDTEVTICYTCLEKNYRCYSAVFTISDNKVDSLSLNYRMSLKDICYY